MTKAGQKLLALLNEMHPSMAGNGIDWKGRIERIEQEAAPSPALTREALSAFLDGHWPDIGVDQSDSTWLECHCGWDSSKPKALDWHAHIMAILAAIGTPPPAPTSTREEL